MTTTITIIKNGVYCITQTTPTSTPTSTQGATIPAPCDKGITIKASIEKP